MKKIKLLLTLAFFTGVVNAEEVIPEHKKAILKYFEITSQKEQYEGGLSAGFTQSLEAGAQNMPAEQKVKFDRAMVKVRKLLEEKVGWSAVKDELVGLYAKSYTQEEIEEVVKSLDNEAIRNYFKKQANLLPELMGVSSKKTQNLMPEVQRIVMEEFSKPDEPAPAAKE